MKRTREFLICCILTCMVLIFFGCTSESNGETLQPEKAVETGMIAGNQYSNATIIHPKTLYQIVDLEAFFQGKTFSDCESEESILSLSDAATRFPDAYLRFIEINDRKLLYLAYPVKEGGTFIATFLLPADMLSADSSAFLVDSVFWAHNLPSKEELRILSPGSNTLGDIEMLHAPMLKGLLSSTVSVSYYLLNDACAAVTAGSALNTPETDSIIRSIDYTSIEDSPFSAFLKSDLEDSNWYE